MLSTSPQNSTTWHSWTLNPENPVGGANYIKEAVSPEAAQTNGFSHRIGVLLFRGLFIAASLVYWYSRDTKPTSSAKDVIVGIGLALSFLISTAHFIISSKETQQRLLWSCNVGNTVCQVAVLVCLFYSANKSQSSPLHLASLLALMVAETTAVRSILASTSVGVLLLAIDPSSRTDYSAGVVSIVGSFLTVALVSYLLWLHAPDAELAKLYAPKKILTGTVAVADKPKLGSMQSLIVQKQNTELKSGFSLVPVPENGQPPTGSGEENFGSGRHLFRSGTRKPSGFWSKAFGADRHVSPRGSIPPQDPLTYNTNTEYLDIVEKDSKSRNVLTNRRIAKGTIHPCRWEKILFC